jgi:uncharacterized lipoprotein YmbA
MEQYVLGNSVTVAAASPRDSASLTIGLRRLYLADYLATRLIVVRHGSHQVVLSDLRRWGEDPGDGINRALGAHLLATPRVRAVDVAPWSVGSRHDYFVQVRIARFEGTVDSAAADSAATEGGVHVVAAWEIIRPADGAVLARGSTQYAEGRWSLGDYAGLVALLDAALSRVALAIHTCLGRLIEAAPAPTTCGS